MAERIRPSDLPDWPRVLRLELAAAYLGFSPSGFERTVRPEVPPIRLSAHTVGWERQALDAWLDRRVGRTPASAEVNPWLASIGAGRAALSAPPEQQKRRRF